MNLLRSSSLPRVTLWFLLLGSLAVIGLAGCATSSVYGPAEAIQAAATHSEGLTGTFQLTIRQTGRQDGNLYLNSETDYRDQRCLTVAVSPNAQRELESVLGHNADAALLNKRIKVTGTAKRVTIWFFAQGVQTDKYYYQTHIAVTNAAQINVLAD